MGGGDGGGGGEVPGIRPSTPAGGGTGPLGPLTYGSCSLWGVLHRRRDFRPALEALGAV